MSEGQHGACDEAASAGRETARLGGEIDRHLIRLAELACTALPASMCAIGWRAGPEAGTVCMPEGAAARAETVIQTLARLQARQIGAAESAPESSRILDAAEVAALSATPATPPVVAAIFSDQESAICVAIAPAPEAPPPEIRALLELVGRAALNLTGALSLAASRGFWRLRATREHADSAARRRDAAERSAFVANLIALPAAEGIAAMGAAIAGAIGCARWIVALNSGGALQVEAASAPPRAGVAVRCSAEFAAAIGEGRTVIREPAARPRANTAESRILGQSWTAIPFAGGALAVGGALEPETRARAEAIVAAAAPLVRSWIAERSLGEFRALVQRMALRMYAAIDDERARIARDLHDDQGQLLAAARLALQGKPEKARVIFEKLERELRSRTRELRPAVLGKLSLIAALESEVALMRQAGFDVHISIGQGVEFSPAHVQQLCFQVVREALTNVMRHSGASLVAVDVERGEGTLRLRVSDDGRGVQHAPQAHTSMGLAGMMERLKLMGGNLQLNSSRSGTTLIAEIPEPL